MDAKYLEEIKARCYCAKEDRYHTYADIPALLAEVERLTQARNYLQELYDKLYERDKNRGEQISTLKKALEKQISKKIVSPEKNYSGLPIVQCPTCDNRDIEYGDCFCKRCGQKLNWNMDNFNK